MKRIVSAILLLLTLALAASAGANLLTNGSFEQKSLGWNPYGVPWNSEYWKFGQYWEVPDGTFCAYVDPFSGDPWEVSWLESQDTFTGTFTLTLWARHYNAHLTSGIWLYAGIGDDVHSVLIDSEEWRELSFTLTGTGPLRLGAYGPGDNFLLLDDVRLVAVPEPTGLLALAIPAAWCLTRRRK